MHIPDGYLSNQICFPLVALMVFIWMVAFKKIRQTMSKADVPLLAFGSAFTFLVMMFNIPGPGGVTIQAVGVVLLAILLGPWAACIGVSLALVIQALLFGDGGILSIGANCLNMGVIMPFVGYYVYEYLKGKAKGLNFRVCFAAFAAGYIGLNAAALFYLFELGIQYLFLKSAVGDPLYFMYSIKTAFNAIITPNLLLGGMVDGAITALGLAIVADSYPDILKKGEFLRLQHEDSMV